MVDVESNVIGSQNVNAAGTNRKHILDVDVLSEDEILNILDQTDAMSEVLRRDIKKVPALRGRVIVTLFYEASTRTRISFEEAGKILSADVINMSSSGSSVDKGESLLNTGLTLQAMGVDVIVVRHPYSGAPNLLAKHLPKVSIINAGDGLHAHPTQALLDAYTVRSKLGSLKGLKIVIVGDVLHSRVARSAIWAFTKLGAEIVLSGPNTLMPVGLNLVDGRANVLPPVSVQPDLDDAIRGADVVMALRLQNERQNGGYLPSLREYIRRWQITKDRLSSASKEVLVMHPGPMNEGIEISTEVAHGGRSLIEEQVTNGVALRMALLYQVSAGGYQIEEEHPNGQ
ncbi:MAG: aspartate carbamoyltransferase [Dehalococcoidia bacterium]|nr:aspartate carbamoyltransferase [Dehalococcoidia bacterium]|tara:strand:+ start:2841 stop:3869 length:1029 start_codon:yes stop_codon:yes gene_type:complete